MQRSIHWHVF